jgi:competence protein ComEC
LAAAGLLLLTIPVSRLKLAGVPLLAAALVLALNVTRPDIYVDADAEAVAVRGADGKLTIHGANRGRLAALSWLAAEADARTTKDELATGFACDANGCVAKLADGTIVAVALRPDAFADDCRDAALVVSKSSLPEACAAPGIDRRTLSTTGAISLRRIDGKWVAETARSPYADRPWYGRPAPPDPAVLDRLARRQPATPAPSIIERPRPGDVPVPDVPEGEILDE